MDLRAGHIGHVLVELVEFAGIAGLDKEIHFLLGHRPHFVEDNAEIQGVSRARRRLEYAGRLAQQLDVPGHYVPDALPLHLYHHRRAVPQDGGVGLRDGGGAQRLPVEGGENPFQPGVILLLDDLPHLVEGHGADLGA